MCVCGGGAIGGGWGGGGEGFVHISCWIAGSCLHSKQLFRCDSMPPKKGEKKGVKTKAAKGQHPVDSCARPKAKVEPKDKAKPTGHKAKPTGQTPAPHAPLGGDQAFRELPGDSVMQTTIKHMLSKLSSEELDKIKASVREHPDMKVVSLCSGSELQGYSLSNRLAHMSHLLQNHGPSRPPADPQMPS